MRGSDVKTCRPWEWIWLVADGRSKGRDMGQPEHWCTFPRGSKFWEILGIALFRWDLHASPQKAYFRPSESSPSSVGPPAQNAPDWGDAAKGGRTVGGDGGRRQF